MTNPKQLGVVLMIVAGALLIIGICIAIVYGDNGSSSGGYRYTSPACIRRGEAHFRMLGRDPDGRFESIEIEAECRRSSRAFAE